MFFDRPVSHQAAEELPWHLRSDGGGERARQKTLKLDSSFNQVWSHIMRCSAYGWLRQTCTQMTGIFDLMVLPFLFFFSCLYILCFHTQVESPRSRWVSPHFLQERVPSFQAGEQVKAGGVRRGKAGRNEQSPTGVLRGRRRRAGKHRTQVCKHTGKFVFTE